MQPQRSATNRLMDTTEAWSEVDRLPNLVNIEPNWEAIISSYTTPKLPITDNSNHFIHASYRIYVSELSISGISNAQKAHKFNASPGRQTTEYAILESHQLSSKISEIEGEIEQRFRNQPLFQISHRITNTQRWFSIQMCKYEDNYNMRY